MANENLKKQMVVKLGTTTNTEAQLISNMVDGALSGKGGNDPELENLKKQMVIKLGTTTNEDAQIISNMVDNAAGGGGSGDLSISEVTLVSSDGLNYSTFVQMAQFDNLEYRTGVTIDENDGFKTAGLDLIVTGEPQIVNVIIMPNKYICAACPPGVGISDFIVTGNAEVDTVTEEGTTIKYVKIYGTCSITLVP